jgi:large subunit ribosomal protein L24
MQKIHEDDKVMVLAGKDKGKIGKVKRVLRKQGKVLVENVNMVKRHTKANPYTQQQGGIMDKEMPIDISNVALMCEGCAKPTRVGAKTTENGKKVRICKKCNETIK